jgi:hypothetical protein
MEGQGRERISGLKNCGKGCILVLTKAQLVEEEMETLKEEAISAISKMPDSADIDEIMYRLYVIDKVRKGREAVLQGDVIPVEELKREIESW